MTVAIVGYKGLIPVVGRMLTLNCIEAVPYTTQKAKKLVSDIKSLLHGENIEKIKYVEKREYIDILKWDEPHNTFLNFLKKFFEDKQ